MDQLKYQVFKPRHLSMTHRDYIKYVGTRVRAGRLDSAAAGEMIALHKQFKLESAAEQRVAGMRLVEIEARLQVLDSEIRNTRTGLHYQNKKEKPNRSLIDLLEPYMIALQKCRNRLQTLMHHPDYEHMGYKASVREYNKRLIEEVKKPHDVVTNDGEHWFDFVPLHIRETAQVAFEAAFMKKAKGVRWRTPFARVESNHYTALLQEEWDEWAPGDKARVEAVGKSHLDEAQDTREWNAVFKNVGTHKKYLLAAAESRQDKVDRIKARKAKQVLLRQAKEPKPGGEVSPTTPKEKAK